MSANRTPAPVAVNVEIDSDDLRRHAELLADEGEHGPAHVLFTAAKHIEAGGNIPEWMGKPAAPRPEPVVAPLPTEAVEEAAEVLYRNAANASWDPDGQPAWEDAGDEVREAVRVDARDALTAALPHLRLVPESAPSEAVERVRADMMNRASRAISGRVDAHRTPDLMKAINALLDAGYRLVPEDDEDTVRLPREAIERLRSAFDHGGPGRTAAAKTLLDALDGPR